MRVWRPSRHIHVGKRKLNMIAPVLGRHDHIMFNVQLPGPEGKNMSPQGAYARQKFDPGEGQNRRDEAAGKNILRVCRYLFYRVSICL